MLGYGLLVFLTVPVLGQSDKAGKALISKHLKASEMADKMAARVIQDWQDTNPNLVSHFKPKKWSYDLGVIYDGLDAMWQRTGNVAYFKAIQQNMNSYITNDGTIINYKASDTNIDHLKNGRTLIKLYKITGQKKYWNAALSLWEQLKVQPRTKEGGFWHKKIYPYQMWLDGLYMGQPFYTDFAVMLNEPKYFEDIANQFIWMENHARDPKTGLMYHGWDESKQEQWANKETGLSPHFWGRAMGWYGMALVDVLEYYPKDNPNYTRLVNILNRFASAVEKVQDPVSGLWYDILDMAAEPRNYHEASASNMFVYTYLKGIRLGVLPTKYARTAEKAYAGILQKFVKSASEETIDLMGTVSVSGLGGKPYRDGSFDYYMSEKVVDNDPKGVGAFLLASNEVALSQMDKPGMGKLLVMDSYFNNEQKPDFFGVQKPWHYKWDELPNAGFSFLGGIMQSQGLKISTLYEAPSVANLKKAAYYLIVDPDHSADNPHPKFVESTHIADLKKWVKKGGVLILMGNDAANAELTHFSELAGSFGIRFKGDSKGRVPVPTQLETALVEVPPGNEIFKSAKNLFIKEYSSLILTAPAKSLLTDADGDVVMASSSYGKGHVFVIGDPWLYNEYVDGRKLPPTFDNFKAAQEWVTWLIGLKK
ncbi:MAG: glycoside hydrolase family 88 protein [Pedobacter sp.]|nr:MAG: glycoside hydrolase family 88 protein [Pedobacter sp.]